MTNKLRLRRWTRYAAGLSTITLLPFFGCSQKETKTEPVVTVEATTAKRVALDQVITAEALLYPIDQAAITPKIAAPVAKFYVQRGAHVKKGELLATLENRDLAAAKSEMKGGYEQAQAAYETTIHASLPEDIQKAELDVRAAKSNLDIQEQIYKSRQSLFTQGAIPRRDLDQAQVTYVQAQNAYNEAEKHLQSVQAVGEQQTKKSAAGQLTSAQAKYEGASAQLSYSEVRSPISGVVTERPLYAGEMASASTPLITVMDTSAVVARAHIPQEQAALLKIGNEAEIDGPDAIKLPGRVTVVSPALDPNSTTVEVWVQAPNPKNTLKAGSSVEIRINAGTIPDAIVIPASAVVPNTEGGGGDAVMVIGADGHAHRKAVKVGIRQGGQAQIVSGIKPGETVITSGGYGLPDNTQVKVSTAAEQPGDKETGPEKPE